MRTDIDPTLATTMASGHFSPESNVYVEPHLPEWTDDHLSGTPPWNPQGHDTKHASGYFYRARSGSLASSENGILYFAKIADTADPSTFDGSWVSTGITGVAKPSSEGTGADVGAQVAIAVSGTTVRIFYFHGTSGTRGSQTVHDLRVITSTDGGSTWGSATTITNVEQHCLAVAAIDVDEIFYTDYTISFDASVKVPYGYTGGDIYSGIIGHATLSGSWSVDTDWPLAGHFIFRRSAREAENILDPTGDDTTWNVPIYAGIGAAVRPDGSYTIVSGGILRHAGRWENHHQAMYVFTYDPDDDYWWWENSLSRTEFAEDSLYWQVFGRCSNVNGNMVAVWQVEDEPTDQAQTDDYTVVPRRGEIVFSYSKDGVLWTEPATVTISASTRRWGTGNMILVGSTLWIITWYHVITAPVTHIFSSSAPQTDITDKVMGWQISQTGRTPDTQLNLHIDDSSDIDPGDLITIDLGADSTLETIGSGYAERIDDSYSIEGREKGGGVSGLMAKPLIDVRSRGVEDILPQEFMIIEPGDLITQMTFNWGDWQVVRADSSFWSTHASVAGLFAGPEAQETFVEISTFDDKIHGGGWWHQLAFLTYPNTMNAEFTCKMRMGLKGVDVAFDTGTKNWPNNIYSEYTNGFGDRWGISGGAEADLDFCAGGIAFRGRDSYSTYVFAWEPGLRSWNLASQWGTGEGETCHADTSFGWIDKQNNQVYNPYRANAITGSYLGSEVVTGSTIANMGGDDRLVLYLFDNSAEDEDRSHQSSLQKRYLLASNSSHGLTRGNPVELKVVTYHGEIHCFYRDLISDGAWGLAFTYDAGSHFGAGRFGLYGRGYNGPEGSAAIPRGMRNRTWFWDARMANNVKAITVEEVCETFAWKAGVEIDTDAAIDTAPSGLYTATALNPVIQASMTLSSPSGFLVRASDANNGIRMSVTPGAIGTGKFSLDVIAAGSSTKQLNAPTWFNIPNDEALLIRFAAHDNWYSVWIEDKLLGTIYYEYTGGLQIGGYGSGTFHSVRMPELVEIPQFATLDAGQSMLDAIRGFLGQRRIKRFITFDGKLRLSYFTSHDDAGTVSNTMIRNALRKNDQGVTHARVLGGLGWAEYKSSRLVRGIRHYVEANLPDIMDRSIMAIEAKTLVTESQGLATQSNFIGHPNIKLEPEDKIAITVTAQGITGDFVVDDIMITWRENEVMQELGTRSYYVE